MDNRPHRASFLSARVSRRHALLAGTATGAAVVSESMSCVAAPSANRVDAGAARLPSFDRGSRLVFIGDSITDMKWGRDESDRNHYLGHSYVFLLAARLGVDMPEAALQFFNRGSSGNRLADLCRRWGRDAVEMKPDLLSVLVGVNDVHGNLDNLDAGQWETDLRQALDASRKANPALRLVLIDPFVLASGPLKPLEAYRRWRSQTDRLGEVVKRLAKELDAAHVPMQEVFDQAARAVSPEHWIWDGIHPLPPGHELIARAWLEALANRWPSG